MNSRRQFMLGAVAIGTIPIVSGGTTFADDPPEKLDEKIVGQFVGKSHGDIETVKKLLAQQPEIVNAAWDWGGGDWETGLGAASHVGRRDIAELLLENGARLDAFAATMLGIKPIVAEMLKSFPKLHTVPGPHGIPLLTHAVFGKEKADAVFELLLASGADVNGKSNASTTPLMAAASVGRVSIVERLLKEGADPVVKNSKEQTALDLAKKREHHDVIEKLEKAMAE